MYKYRTIIAFIIVAALQLFIPAQMIWHQESILMKGKEYKFQTAPIDPNDPFRGKYITLNYTEDMVEVKDTNMVKKAEFVFIFLRTDDDGFAKLDSVSDKAPAEGDNFLKVPSGAINNGKMYVELPFNRFYMEESKAEMAEKAYVRFNRDSLKKAYALVNIRNGEAAIKDVMIDGKSLIEIVKEQNKKAN